MLQRIQTVYMILALTLLIVCACLPVGTYVPVDMNGTQDLYNLCIIDGNSGSWSFTSAGLIAVLAVSVAMIAKNIFNYNNRGIQIRNCSFAIILLLVWVVLYALYLTILAPENYNGEFGFAAVLPIISIIFLLLARRGIINDEKLIRSVDRIR